MTTHKISQGRVKRWLRCKREYYHNYVEGLKRRRIKRPLKFGSLIHDMLEVHANKQDPFEVLDSIDPKEMKLLAAQRDEIGDIIEDARVVFQGYLDHWPKRDLTYIKVGGQYAEHHFELELFPDVIWQGYVDAFGRTPNKLRWLVENKTFKRRPGEDHYWRNLQSVTYLRAADEMGWPSVEGTLWNYIHSMPPGQPQVLKNGTLSKARGVNTTPAVYRQAIKDNGLDERDYADILEHLEFKMDDRYFRVHTPVNASISGYMFDDFKKNVREMVDHTGDHYPMSIDRHCEWCDYEPICRALLQGTDVDFVKEREYTTDATEKRKQNSASKAKARRKARRRPKKTS